MDDHPFLEFNILDPRDTVVSEVKKFHKESFNADDLFSAASNMKYTTQIRAVFDAELKEPTDDFLRFLLRDVHIGKITQHVLEKFRPVVKRSIGLYLNEMIGDKLKSAIETTMEGQKQITPGNAEPTDSTPPTAAEVSLQP